MTQTIDIEAAWDAFERRDRNADGRFVVAVRTTGIYCKPSCAARHPKRENVSFHTDPAAARAAGYRACLRCLPDAVGRDRVAVADAIALIEASEKLVSLDELAARIGYAPHHFHRLFKRATGVTPAAYSRGLRATRVGEALKEEANVTNAIYEAGYSAPSRFYEHGAKRLGMSPSAWARGGAGVTIRWTVADTSLGALFVAATDKGLCRVSFDEDERGAQSAVPEGGDLTGRRGAGDARGGSGGERRIARARPPSAARRARDRVSGGRVAGAARDSAGRDADLRRAGATCGNPKAVRAAGSACGANHVAVVVPCHRAQRTDGTLGGYAYGLERKRVLLAREGADD